MQPKTDPAAREVGDVVEVTQRLTVRFPELPLATVQAEVDRAHQRFHDAPIRDFVPVFVERAARDALGRHQADAGPPRDLAS